MILSSGPCEEFGVGQHFGVGAFSFFLIFLWVVVSKVLSKDVQIRKGNCYSEFKH